MASHVNHDTSLLLYTQEELIRLREQLKLLGEHLKHTTAVTSQQEAVVSRIRTQLQGFDPSKADFAENQNWYKQQETLAMEKHKLDEIAEQRDHYVDQIRAIEEKFSTLAGQSRGQQENPTPASAPANEGPVGDLYDAQETPTNDAPTSEDILLFQLTQTQQELNAMTEESNNLRNKNMSSAKRSAILSREKQLIEKENFVLRKHRNVLQHRLDVLEDQGIDIGKPRNDLEAEARAARRQQREKNRHDGLAGAKIFPALETIMEAFQSVMLETELLNSTDEIEAREPETLLSPKERHDIDMLFDEGSDESARWSTLQESSANMNGVGAKQEIHAPMPPQFVSRGCRGEDMVYGDENSEDLIDWTPDDQYEFISYPPASVQVIYASGIPTQANDISAPLSTQYPPTLSNPQGHEANFTAAQDLARQHHDSVLNQPWDNLARPLSPRTSPPIPQDDDQECHNRIEKLNQLQSWAGAEFGLTLIDLDQFREFNQTTQQRDAALYSLEQSRGELEQFRRDLATRTGERNGARQRIAILEDEIKQREINEVQLREELRLEREEDPLADKLFVELAELRKQFEEAEEQNANAQENIVWLKKKVVDGAFKREEDLEKFKALEDGAEKGNAIVAEYESRIQAGNDQLDSLTSTLYARDAEIESLNAQLAALHASQAEIEQLTMELAATKEELEKAKSAAANTDVTITLNAEIHRLTSELLAWKQELDNTRSQTQGCQSSLQKATTALATSQDEVKKLSTELKQVKEERDRAQNEARNAVAAAEKARDEGVESRRALGAANDMGHRLRRISSENIRELVHVREERDSAVHDVSRFTRDLSFARDEAVNLKGKIEEFEREREVLTGRFLDAERRAVEYGHQVLELEGRIEELGKLVQDLSGEADDKADGDDTKMNDAKTKMEEVIDEILGAHDSTMQRVPVADPASPASLYLIGEELDSVARPVDRSTPAPKGPKSRGPRGPRAKPLGAPRRKGERVTRNPAPVYVDPPSPRTSRPPKRTPPRGRRAGEDGDYEEGPRPKK